MESRPRLRPVLHGDTQTELGERFDSSIDECPKSVGRVDECRMRVKIAVGRDEISRRVAGSSSADSLSQPSRDSRLTQLPVGRDLREACIGRGLGEPRVVSHVCE